MPRIDHRHFTPIAAGLLLVMAVVMVFWGRLHPDEGFYTFVAAATLEGRLPFRDYFYVQTPLAPLLLAPGALIGDFFGLRFFCAVTGLGFLFLARRSLERCEWQWLLLLTVTCPFFVAFMATVKLYGPATLLLAGAGMLLVPTAGKPSEALTIRPPLPGKKGSGSSEASSQFRENTSLEKPLSQRERGSAERGVRGSSGEGVAGAGPHEEKRRDMSGSPHHSLLTPHSSLGVRGSWGEGRAGGGGEGILLATFLIALAVATRVSVLPGLAVPITVLWRRHGWRWAIAGLAVSGGTLAAALLPFWSAAPETFTYAVFAYQFDKDAIPFTRFLFFRVLMVRNLALHYHGMWLVSGWLLWANRHRLRWRWLLEDGPVQRLLWLVGLVTLAHLPNKKATIDAHLTLIYPVAALALAKLAASRTEASPPPRWLLPVIALGAAVQLPGHLAPPEFPLAWQKMIATVNATVPEHLALFSYHQAIPVVTGHAIPRGYEMNTIHFSGEWSPATCRERHVLHVDGFYRLLRDRQIALLVTETTWSHDFPRFRPIPDEAHQAIRDSLDAGGYAVVERFPKLGYFGEEVVLMLPGVAGDENQGRDEGR